MIKLMKSVVIYIITFAAALFVNQSKYNFCFELHCISAAFVKVAIISGLITVIICFLLPRKASGRKNIAHNINYDSNPKEWSLELLNELDWKVFEDLTADYFRMKGRKAEVTKLGADEGIDVLLYELDNSAKLLGIVQCKAWTKKVVGVRNIRELFGVMTDKGCPLGVFVTIAGYSSEAKEFAANKTISLIDGIQFLKLLKSLPDDKQDKLLKNTTAGDYKTPSCPSHGVKLTLKKARRGRNYGKNFWGCKYYPSCRYTMPVKDV